MSFDIVIRAEGLGKSYTIGHQSVETGQTLRDTLARGFDNLIRTTRDLLHGRPLVAGDAMEEFHALQDVSFEVRRGEVLGIIGHNGAGKSTLLKILARVTEPSQGRVEIKGRVASLLEVGTGFHPELSGRENIFLNGAILGMSRKEIQARFDEIVVFAGVEKFLDTPVKRYSSGMYVRLAFAVAAHLDPEILIIDEVLSVGDAEFQKKCLGKIHDVARGGRTVLFVSHNLRSIADLCTSAIQLEHGLIAISGTPREVVGRYLSGGGNDETEWCPRHELESTFCYNRVRILNGSSGAPPEGSVPYTDPVVIELDYTVRGALPDGRLAIKLTNDEGLTVFGTTDTDSLASSSRQWRLGKFESRCEIPGSFLRPGRYKLAISQPLAAGGDEVHEDVLSFTVNGLGNPGERDGRSGVVAPLLKWNSRELARQLT